MEERVDVVVAAEGVIEPPRIPRDNGVPWTGVRDTPFNEAVNDVFSLFCAVLMLPSAVAGGASLLKVSRL